MTEKLYLENPYLRQIEARIVDKKYMNDKYYLKTNKTIFYPHLAGGQPGDKGTINGIEVLETYEDGDDVVLVVKENIHSDKAKLNIDWKNRFDYMQQHSGQHLLSSVFYKLFNGETIGFYIGKEYVYIDVSIPKISQDEIIKVEEFANKIIFSNFLIKSYIVEKEEMSMLPIRKEPKVNSNIRIVEIDGIDFSPCCGTHVRNTGEIGIIKIRKVESYKGNIRVEFVCGYRALSDYIWKSDYIKDISNLLSCKDKDVKDRVEKLYIQKEELEKNNRALKEEVSKYEAKKLLRESKSIKGINLISKKFYNRDLKDLHHLSQCLISNENVVSILGVENNESCQFVINRSKDLNLNIKNMLDEISKNINIKGGGTSQTVQGKCEKENIDDFINNFEKIIISSLK